MKEPKSLEDVIFDLIVTSGVPPIKARETMKFVLAVINDDLIGDDEEVPHNYNPNDRGKLVNPIRNELRKEMRAKL